MPTVPDVRVGMRGNCHWQTDADDGEVEVGGSMSESMQGGGERTTERTQAHVYVDGVNPRPRTVSCRTRCASYTLENLTPNGTRIYGMTDPIDVIDGMDGLCYRLQEIIICNIFFVARRSR